MSGRNGSLTLGQVETRLQNYFETVFPDKKVGVKIQYSRGGWFWHKKIPRRVGIYDISEIPAKGEEQARNVEEPLAVVRVKKPINATDTGGALTDFVMESGEERRKRGYGNLEESTLSAVAEGTLVHPYTIKRPNS